MKRLLLLVLLAVLLTSCEQYHSTGPDMPFPIEKGAVRTTETDDYIATEVCIGLNGTCHPVWKLESISKKTKGDIRDNGHEPAAVPETGNLF